MPTTAEEFRDDSAFERYTLDRATPLIPRTENTSRIELGPAGSASIAAGAGTAHVYVGVTDSAGSAPGGVTIEEIQPLLFGAAWKVLDLLVELGLERVGVGHDRSTGYTIGLKASRSRNTGVPAVTPFDRHPDFWSRMTAVYAATEQVRHSLVHRQLIVTAAGDISATGGTVHAGTTTLTVAQQSAICRLAVGAADAVITAQLPGRRLDQLRWVVDNLGALHHQPAYGVAASTGLVPLVVVRPAEQQPGKVTLDLDDIVRRARAAVGGVTHYDLSIVLPDGRSLAGQLEEAPTGEIDISLAAPPAWLHWA